MLVSSGAAASPNIVVVFLTDDQEDAGSAQVLSLIAEHSSV
jgi:hypothetical protein